MSKNHGYKKQLKYLIPSISFIFSTLIVLIGSFTLFKGSIESILNKSPDSNLALLINAVDNFFKDAIYFGFAAAAVFAISSLITSTLKRKSFSNPQLKTTFLYSFYILILSVAFIILMAATKPENSTFTLNMLSYVASFIYLLYNSSKNKTGKSD